MYVPFDTSKATIFGISFAMAKCRVVCCLSFAQSSKCVAFTLWIIFTMYSKLCWLLHSVMWRNLENQLFIKTF